jgi:hypothetical protein
MKTVHIQQRVKSTSVDPEGQKNMENVLRGGMKAFILVL